MRKILSVGIPIVLLLIWGLTIEYLPSSGVEGSSYNTVIIVVVGILAIVAYFSVLAVNYFSKEESSKTKTILGIFGLLIASGAFFMYYLFY